MRRHHHAETAYAEVDRQGEVRSVALRRTRPPGSAHAGCVWIPYPKVLPLDHTRVRFLWGDGRWHFDWKSGPANTLDDIDRLIVVKG